MRWWVCESDAVRLEDPSPRFQPNHPRHFCSLNNHEIITLFPVRSFCTTKLNIETLLIDTDLQTIPNYGSGLRSLSLPHVVTSVVPSNKPIPLLPSTLPLLVCVSILVHSYCLLVKAALTQTRSAHVMPRDPSVCGEIPNVMPVMVPCAFHFRDCRLI